MAYDDQDGNLVVRAEAATEWRERAQRLERELDAMRAERDAAVGILRAIYARALATDGWIVAASLADAIRPYFQYRDDE